MIIPTVTNVNRPNTILMAGAAAMSPRFFFSISDQKIKSFWRDLWTVFAEGKEKKRGALIKILSVEKRQRRKGVSCEGIWALYFCFFFNLSLFLFFIYAFPSFLSFISLLCFSVNVFYYYFWMDSFSLLLSFSEQNYSSFYLKGNCWQTKKKLKRN